MICRLTLAGLVWFVSAAVGVAAEPAPWAGVWSADPSWCAAADRIGSVTPAPVRLTAQTFDGYENSCDITSAQQIGTTDAYRLTTRCQSEGSTYDDALLVILEGPDRLWQVFGGFDAVAFLRCPGTGK